MPTTDVTNTLIANITSTEQSTSNVPINRSNGNPAYASNMGVFNTYLNLGAGPNVIPLPTPGNIFHLYIKNLDPTKTITVAWGINGGATNPVIALNPAGDQIIVWLNPTGTVTPGISSLTLTPSAANCLCEYFIGG